VNLYQDLLCETGCNDIERSNKCAEMASKGWVLVSEFGHEPWDGSAPVLRLSFRRLKSAAPRKELK
jgi:hypothetical protein